VVAETAQNIDLLTSEKFINRITDQKNLKLVATGEHTPESAASHVARALLKAKPKTKNQEIGLAFKVKCQQTV